MRRTDIINAIIKKYKYKSYLEIGVKDPSKNFDQVKVESKYGIDPNWKGVPIEGFSYKTDSDTFFNTHTNFVFDIVFIDGLHYHKQVTKDFNNSFKYLSENGTIILHDCNPTSKAMQSYPRTAGTWTGDTWKTIAILRTTPYLNIFTVNTDFGCAVIRRGRQNPIETERLTWEYFRKNKKQILNLKTVGEFKLWLKN